MALSNSDIDYIEGELKQTTVGAINHKKDGTPYWEWPPPKAATHWNNAYTRLESGRAATPPPPSNRIDCFPGDWVNVDKQLVDGSAVQLRSGIHQEIDLDKSFSAGKRVTFFSDADAIVKHGFKIDSVGGYAFVGVHMQILDTDVDTGSIDPRVLDLRGSWHDILVSHCKIEGGFACIYPYSGGPSFGTNLEIRDNDISGAWGDLIHTEYVDGLVIDHNNLHDPRHLNPEHHDCWQSVSTKNAKFTRNTISWLNGEGHYTGPTPNYLGQGMMMSGLEHGARNSDFEVSNNLIHHYNGRPLNMNGVDRLKVVNNTFVDSGDGISITFGQNCTEVAVWNNILNYAYLDSNGSAPAYIDYNWYLQDSGIKGANTWFGDPFFIDKVLYHLQTNSLARGKGIARAGTPTIDLDGNVRSTVGLGCWA